MSLGFLSSISSTEISRRLHPQDVGAIHPILQLLSCFSIGRHSASTSTRSTGIRFLHCLNGSGSKGWIYVKHASLPAINDCNILCRTRLLPCALQEGGCEDRRVRYTYHSSRRRSLLFIDYQWECGGMSFLGRCCTVENPAIVTKPYILRYFDPRNHPIHDSLVSLRHSINVYGLLHVAFVTSVRIPISTNL